MFKKTVVSEEELIQKCKQGNLIHQEKLYMHFYSYAMGVGLRYLNDRDDALEVVNDSFIKVFKSIGSFKNEQNFKPWLRKIVVNTALDRRRKELKHQNQDNIEAAEYVSFAPQAVAHLNAQDILKLLDTLPYVQRTVFNMYEIDGYNHEEIGDLLQISASSSRVNLSRAKEKLREALRLEESEYERNDRSGTYR
ncbi:RNA polymerase sigma factor [Daejeonella lutea]|uniref:RNA polymerase sigma-70 factor, ECF subfamily n=1 Tax=Daejeonella lutea TaxID=572036 RepID=A0A1T5A2P4_9SPHI|nr:RNA polymerase sigma factor [Daejeonella lutea]SKB29281.1 RNA polymerase sigma-70 factor, ECF subfamily [Daejeonella lutea]